MRLENARAFNDRNDITTKTGVEQLQNNLLQPLLAERVYKMDFPGEVIDMNAHDDKQKVLFWWTNEKKKNYARAFETLKNSEDGAGLLNMNIKDSDALDAVARALYSQVTPPPPGSLGAGEAQGLVVDL